MDIFTYLCAKDTTNTYGQNMAKAKPFIKWVGGKNQLIEQLDAQLPAEFGNWEDVTYIEPLWEEVLCYSICCNSTQISVMLSLMMLTQI